MQTVGGYQLLGELGQGGMGRVYRARDPRLGREVALKTVTGVRDDPELAARFQREAQAMAKLRHPGVVAIHDVGSQGGQLYLVAELLRGGTLEQRIRREGPLPPAEVARLGARLARALEHAHSRGVLHRDLKPGNVLFDEAGEPVLCDFGLARVLDDEGRLTVSGELLGTPVYMAPEQALARRDVGPAADVYGLGATLYRALTGERPFSAAMLPQLLEAVLHDPPPPPSALVRDVPPALERVILRCLEKRPEDRFASAAELASACEALATPPQRPASPLPPPPPPSRPVASASIGVLLALAGALGVLAAALWRDRSQSRARANEALVQRAELEQQLAQTRRASEGLLHDLERQKRERDLLAQELGATLERAKWERDQRLALIDESRRAQGAISKAEAQLAEILRRREELVAQDGELRDLIRRAVRAPGLSAGAAKAGLGVVARHHLDPAYRLFAAELLALSGAPGEALTRCQGLTEPEDPREQVRLRVVLAHAHAAVGDVAEASQQTLEALNLSAREPGATLPGWTWGALADALEAASADAKVLARLRALERTGG